MMNLRPIVIDADNTILGGNMRFKAIQHLGYKEIPDSWVKRADELTKEEKQRFIIADNVSGGEWDWEILKDDWDVDKLNEWGLDVPDWAAGVPENEMTDDDVNLSEEFDPVGVSSGLQKIVFIFDGKEEAESFLNKFELSNVDKRGQAWQVNMSSQSI